MITKCFFITKSFQENSGAENLLLRVHEHHSDLSGAEECSRGGELREQRTSEVRHKELDCAKAL